MYVIYDYVQDWHDGICSKVTEQIEKRLALKPADSPFEQSEVAATTGTMLILDRHCVAVPAPSLRKQLQTQRLSKEALRGVPSVDLDRPECAEESGDMEHASKVYLFADDEQPNMTGKIRKFAIFHKESTKLQKQGPTTLGNLHEGHADDMLEKLVADGTGNGWACMLQGGIPHKSLPKLLAGYQVWQAQSKALRCLRSSGGSSSALGESAALKMSGRASGDMEVVDAEAELAQQAENIMIDLSEQQQANSTPDHIADGVEDCDEATCMEGEDEAADEDESTGHLSQQSAYVIICSCQYLLLMLKKNLCFAAKIWKLKILPVLVICFHHLCVQTLCLLVHIFQVFVEQ